MKALFALAGLFVVFSSSATANADPQSDAVWAYKHGDKVCNFFVSGVDAVSIGQAISYVQAYGHPPKTVQAAVGWNCPEHVVDVAGYLQNVPPG